MKSNFSKYIFKNTWMKYLVTGIILVYISCIGSFPNKDPFNKRYEYDNVIIPEFQFSTTVVFEKSLSKYNIFKGNQADLAPSRNFHLLELGSTLFTDYAHKQRLINIPEGTRILNSKDESIDFPNGTILVKTFFYFHDERDPNLGKRIIESRLLIKEEDIWNVATYVWNEEQTDAILESDGTDIELSWIHSDGNEKSTLYQVPSQK